MNRPALGRGLAALIPEGAEPKERIQTIAVDRIDAAGNQPRSYFSQSRLKELAESIGEKGVIQPILVRAKGDRFEIIAGERRYRAAKLRGIKEIPVIIRQVKDDDALEIALIENIQREELTKIEEAKAYKKLASQFGLTHDDISKKVSKDRTSVSNTLRLLELPQRIQDFLEQSSISMGHGRALLSLGSEKEQLKICNRIIKRSLSVRQSENLIRNKLSGAPKKKKVRGDVHISAVEDKLQHHLGTRVKISQGLKRGKVVIDFYSTDDLNRVLSILFGGKTGA